MLCQTEKYRSSYGRSLFTAPRQAFGGAFGEQFTGSMSVMILAAPEAHVRAISTTFKPQRREFRKGVAHKHGLWRKKHKRKPDVRAEDGWRGFYSVWNVWTKRNETKNSLHPAWTRSLWIIAPLWTPTRSSVWMCVSAPTCLYKSSGTGSKSSEETTFILQTGPISPSRGDKTNSTPHWQFAPGARSYFQRAGDFWPAVDATDLDDVTLTSSAIFKRVSSKASTFQEESDQREFQKENRCDRPKRAAIYTWR